MPGPCPNGWPTMLLHREARCRDKERCTGQGCRVRRAPREKRTGESVKADLLLQAARELVA